MFREGADVLCSEQAPSEGFRRSEAPQAARGRIARDRGRVAQGGREAWACSAYARAATVGPDPDSVIWLAPALSPVAHGFHTQPYAGRGPH